MGWTSKSFLNWCVDRLTGAGVDSPGLDSEVLLAGALEVSREELYLRPDRVLEEREVTVGRSFVERRMHREPVAYILGNKAFWDLEFKVDQNVLTPRPETEILIECFLNKAKTYPADFPLRILDIGTGSGNIAVVAAREFPQSQVTAVDISAAALSVAKENARLHGVSGRIRFLLSDLFESIPDATFNYILSNPPYIETDKIPGLMPDVKCFEPVLALDGGEKGLDVYQRLIFQAHDFLAETGTLIVEMGETQVAGLTQLFKSHGGYTDPEVVQDYGGYDRVMIASKGSHG